MNRWVNATVEWREHVTLCLPYPRYTCSCTADKIPCIRFFQGQAMNENSSSLNYVAPVFRVADLARSLAYYRDKLDFKVEFNYEGYILGFIQQA
jgi:hypothetical protein